VKELISAITPEVLYYETQAWLTKAKQRNLIHRKDYENFLAEIKDIGIKLNNHIKTTRTQTTPKSKLLLRFFLLNKLQ